MQINLKLEVLKVVSLEFSLSSAKKEKKEDEKQANTDISIDNGNKLR
jgi:predicted acetyltransferase